VHREAAEAVEELAPSEEDAEMAPEPDDEPAAPPPPAAEWVVMPFPIV
jgi:hypothetical protein